MAKKDVFGFEELQARFEKLETKWPNEVSRVLRTSGQAMRTRTQQLTNKGPLRKTSSGNMSTPGRLKRSWRLMPERYKVEGKFVYRFIRVASTAPHAHLVNIGHKLWVGGQGKGKPTVISFAGQTFKVKGSSSKQQGWVQGQGMVNRAKKELLGKFGDSVEKMFDKLTKGWEV